MKKTLLSAVIAIFGVQIFAADITGTITFKGTPPAENSLTEMESMSDCISMHDTTPTTHFYVVNSTNGGFGDVVVYLKNVSAKSTGASAKPAVLDQVGCLYTPGIMAIQTGQTLTVKNSDPCNHNVHGISEANGKETTIFNDQQPSGGAELTYTFDKPEMFFKFECNIHPWMKAWVCIFDHPYFAVTDADGKFTIKNVPPGKYTIEANHRKLGAQSQEIEVKDSGATANFTFNAPAAAK